MANITLNIDTCITSTKNGALYNLPSVLDIRKITSTDDWNIPLISEFQTLADYAGGLGNYETNSIGGKLKEAGFEHWIEPNLGATNELNFNGRGAGTRTAGFSSILTHTYMWAQLEIAPGWGNAGSLDTANSIFYCIDSTWFDARNGYSIRVVRLATESELLLPDGVISATYTGNNGKIYPTVKIGTQVWVSCNLKETQYRNGDYITGFDGGVYTPILDGDWATLTTEAMCYYENDVNNV